MSRRTEFGRVRLVSNGSPTQTTARLFATLADGLRLHGHSVEFTMRQLPRGIWPKLKTLPGAEAANARRMWRIDVFIVHTPLALSVLSILIARMMGRRVVAFVWDLHPESTRIVGNLRNPILLSGYWLLERMALALASSIVIPSTDYAPAVRRWQHKVRTVPLWPCDSVAPVENPEPRIDAGDLHVGFAGQINGIRALAPGVETLLGAWKGDRLRLHLFSKDDCPDDLAALAARSDRLEIVHHGEVAPEILQKELRNLDAGWVSLDPDFDLPAFPSKALAYICAGIPVLFNGPPLRGYREWLKGSGLGICIDESPFGPADLRALADGFAASREAYFSVMEERWFEVESLL